MRKSFIYLSVFILSIIITGCGKETHRKDKDPAVPVRIMKVKLENLYAALEYVGNIKGEDEVMVYPKISGKIIEKVKPDGSPIAKGEAIAYIDRDEVGLKFEKAPVESPLTGIVGRVYVDIGSNVTAQTAIALVTTVDRVQIDLEIPEKYLPDILVGQTAEVMVDAYPNDKFIGKVTKVSPIVELQTRAAPIEIIMDNADHRLQSGMFAKVRLILKEKKNVPIILREAIIGRPPDTYVYIVEDKKAIFRKVALGIREGPYYEVRDGIKEGESVVIMGQQRLRDGSIVEPEE